MFEGCLSLEYVTLIEGVTQIPHSCFCKCIHLKHIKLPDTLKSIGKHAFRECISLKSILLPSSVICVEEVAFFDCSILSSLVFLNNKIILKDHCIEKCSQIQSIYLGEEQMKTIEFEVSLDQSICFKKYSIECKRISLSRDDRLKYKGEWQRNMNIVAHEACCFAGCELQSVIIPNYVTRIEPFLFKDCNHLTSMQLGTSLTYIPDYCCENCINLRIGNIAQTITSFGKHCFMNCLAPIEYNSKLTIDYFIPPNVNKDDVYYSQYKSLIPPERVFVPVDTMNYDVIDNSYNNVVDCLINNNNWN